MSNRTRPLRPHKKKGFWYLVRRVPTPYRDYDKRGMVFQSTGVRIADDPHAHVARHLLAKLDADLFEHWRKLADEHDPDPRQRHAAAVATARSVGIDYAVAGEVAKMPPRAIVDRIKLLGDPTRQSAHQFSALLGGVEPPQILLSQLREEHEAIVSASLAQKSPRQLHRWRTHNDTAVSVFTEVLGGDRPLVSLTRHDALLLRKHWQDRVVAGEIAIDTANKNIGRVAGMLRSVNDSKMLGIAAIFDKTVIRGAKLNQRIPYHVEFVQDRILADGVFDDVNAEARRIVYLVTETGLRLSEACNLTANTIRLDHAVPHVQVRPDGREMKTDHSHRDIPLVGAALMAMKEQPQGFPRYRDKADTLSALINKALEARKLRPNGETLYSLRHTFKDRLRAVGAPDELKDALMGHKREQPSYGFGYSLQSKAEWLNRIALRPPSSV